MSDAQRHVCVLTDCENGILHEYDCNDSFGNHCTGVIYCPVCHPEQYEPDSDPLIAAAPEMFELLAEIRDQHLVPRCGMDDCTDCDDKIFAGRIDALLATMEGK